MRKHSPRKWLHAILDLLPVLIIGVFALYTTNKNAVLTQAVTVEQDDIVENTYYYQQGLKDGLFYNLNDEVYYSHLNCTLNDNVATFYSTTTTYYWDFNINGDLPYAEDDILLVKFDFSSSGSIVPAYFCLTNEDGETVLDLANITVTDTLTTYYVRSSALVGVAYPEDNNFIKFFMSPDTRNDTNIYSLCNVNLFNLTSIFGSGNEPSIAEFNDIFVLSYYPYTDDLQSITYTNIVHNSFTYNDTDVGSQLVYTLYNTTEKYFNMNGVFNLGSMWDWITLNIFNGHPPLIAYVIWNIIIYEFIMDLLFLFYMVFMFVIDFAECVLEKPFNRIK